MEKRKGTCSIDEFYDSSIVGFESNNDDDDCEGNKIVSVESSELFGSSLLQECAYLENDFFESDIGFTSLGDDLFCDDLQDVEIFDLRESGKEDITTLDKHALSVKFLGLVQGVNLP
ncbi:hypothetical protein RJT34_23566 [Clitoria ternatea]|uniref:Uncharacterized protein n=1 Tax=Clitoria ternatea TaxID=43366 RepID=A0AAN9FPA2_CLITE